MDSSTGLGLSKTLAKDTSVTNEDLSIVNMLVIMGVEEQTAIHRICASKSKRAAVTFHEIYGGGSIVQCANQARCDLNIKGLRALDL